MLYDMLSAFCKSLRGSDSDAALAWFSRMNYAGLDPRVIVRRVIAHASEDVGLANPDAMVQAVSAWQALEAIGMPEARLSIAQAIIAVCESPKSNAVVVAIDRAMRDAERGGFQPFPVHLRDTSYRGAARLGYGEATSTPMTFQAIT
jgi:putative ATPase